MKKTLLGVLLSLFVVLSFGARADEKKKGDEGWESVQTSMVQPGEGFAANQLVAGAYAFIWVMVAGFVWTVWRRTEAVEKEIETLRQRVQKGGAGQAGTGRT